MPGCCCDFDDHVIWLQQIVRGKEILREDAEASRDLMLQMHPRFVPCSGSFILLDAVKYPGNCINYNKYCSGLAPCSTAGTSLVSRVLIS